MFSLQLHALRVELGDFEGELSLQVILHNLQLLRVPGLQGLSLPRHLVMNAGIGGGELGVGLVQG